MSAKNFLENFMAAQLIIELPVVLEPESLLSCSQKSATASYREPLNKTEFTEVYIGVFPLIDLFLRSSPSKTFCEFFIFPCELHVLLSFFFT
jgi:hypothetical protein